MKGTALVLGANGFIGSHLLRRLADHGYQVIAVTKHRKEALIRDDFQHILCDIEDTSQYATELKAADLIVYAAGKTVPGDTQRGPVSEIELSLSPLAALLNKMNSVSGKHLVYISSGGAVYGKPRVTPIPEQHTLCPVSYYGAGKLAAEGFLRVFALQSRNQVTILRPSNLYGPGQSARPGFGLIRTAIMCLLKNRPLEIWGDGSAARDYLYIDDFSDAFLHLLDETPDSGLQVFNIGYGQAFSVNEVCNLLELASGRQLTRKYIATRKSDPQQVCLDTSLLQARTLWTPKIQLGAGIQITWDSYSKPAMIRG